MGQGSFCSLTLDEVQDQLGNLGKPLGTMNLDELLRSVDSVGAWSEQMHRQGSLTWSRDLSKMTVEEIWRDIQQQNQNQNQNQKEADNPWRNAPFGTHAPGRKRVAPGDVVEKTVERKQKRMIKNRESAARSRARRQAYTHELEIKVSHLEEENERLRKQKSLLSSSVLIESNNRLILDILLCPLSLISNGLLMYITALTLARISNSMRLLLCCYHDAVSDYLAFCRHRQSHEDIFLRCSFPCRRRRRSCHLRRLLKPCLSYEEQVQPLSDTSFSWLTVVLVQVQDILIDNLSLQISILAGGLYISGFNG
ncbi:hypothetical protein OIU76_010612 [Salix suchowensis]|nr:hypothetical protein OIU76_010612 [Salix suchowensis]